MNQTRLPLQFRIAIRDSWDNAGSPMQTALKKLGDTLGIPITVQFEWPMLWAQLEKHFPDKHIFVPSINGVVSAWRDAMEDKLEEEDDTPWSDRFLEEIKGERALVVRVEANIETQPAISWHKNSSSIILKVPNCPPPYAPNLKAVFNTQLLSLFGSDPNDAVDDEWANIAANLPSRSKPPSLTTMPSLDTISRPELLFPQATPYHMILRHSSQSIIVQGSHQPSLELLAAYLMKWTKTMQNDVRKLPVLKITLEESTFGLGVLYDALIIEPTDDRQTWLNVNPILIIAFLEHVLGYVAVTTELGANSTGFGTSVMSFRRHEPFA